jgi:hypothetical protein
MCRNQHLQNEEQTSQTLFEKDDRLKMAYMAVAGESCGATGSGDERLSNSRYYLRAHKLRSWKRALKMGSGVKDGDFFLIKWLIICQVILCFGLCPDIRTQWTQLFEM